MKRKYGMRDGGFTGQKPQKLVGNQTKLDLNKEMILFCAGGLRSALATKSLKDMGFENISHIEGGFGSLKQSKFKIV